MNRPSLLNVPRRRPLTKVCDPFTVGGEEVRFTLQKLGPHGQTIAIPEGEEFAERFSKNWFPMPGGSGEEGFAVEVTPLVARQLAFLKAAQSKVEVRTEGSETWESVELYDMENLLGLMVNFPEEYERLITDLYSMDAPKKDDDEGNASKGSTGA